MKELLEYRKQLVARLVTASEEFRDACLAVNDLHTPLEGGWNVHQIAAHTRDVDKLIYGSRVQRTAGEENPEFTSFNSDIHMSEHYDVNEPLEEILDDIVINVKALSEMLTALPVETWSRASRHTTLGGSLTLQTWVERGLAHIEEHLETVKRGITN